MSGTSNIVELEKTILLMQLSLLILNLPMIIYSSALQLKKIA